MPSSELARSVSWMWRLLPKAINHPEKLPVIPPVPTAPTHAYTPTCTTCRHTHTHTYEHTCIYHMHPRCTPFPLHAHITHARTHTMYTGSAQTHIIHPHIPHAPHRHTDFTHHAHIPRNILHSDHMCAHVHMHACAQEHTHANRDTYVCTHCCQSRSHSNKRRQTGPLELF